MRGLVVSRFKPTLLYYIKPRELSVCNVCNWMYYRSCSYCITNRRSTILSRSNNSSPDVSNIDYTLKSVKWFSLANILLKSKDRGKDKKKGPQAAHIDLKEMAEVCNVEKLTSEYERAVENLKDQFIKYVSLRTTVGAIEQVPVKFEGDTYVLQELVQITRNPKMLILNASSFPQTIPSIIESLSKTQMNLNPQQDGTTLFITIPKVTKEHREGLSKHAKSLFIKCRDNIKDIRNKYIKTLKKDTKLPKDTVFRVEGYINAMSLQYVNNAEKLLEIKEKELLGDSS